MSGSLAITLLVCALVCAVLWAVFDNLGDRYAVWRNLAAGGTFVFLAILAVGHFCFEPSDASP